MSIITKIIGGSIAEPIEAVGDLISKLYTTDGEKLDKEALLLRLTQRPYLAQIALNKAEAAHRSLFVAGWRPFIGWVCGLGLTYSFLLRPFLIVWGANAPSLDMESIIGLLVGMLGLGGYRTYEKIKGRSR